MLYTVNVVVSWLVVGFHQLDLQVLSHLMVVEGYWTPDASTLNMVANMWGQMIATNGVACCDCSCDNIATIEWTINYVSDDLLAHLKSVMYGATQQSQFAPGQTPNPTLQVPTIQYSLILSNNRKIQKICTKINTVLVMLSKISLTILIKRKTEFENQKH